jgi:phosphohistidine phosphatase SixA
MIAPRSSAVNSRSDPSSRPALLVSFVRHLTSGRLPSFQRTGPNFMIMWLIMKRSLLCCFLIALFLGPASAQPVVFIVRHAEKANASKDIDLSRAGLSRAQALAKTLRDANITAIYVTEFKRTQQTAAPLARALHIRPINLAAKDTATLTTKLRAAHGNVLVVGHGNTIPNLIQAMGISKQLNIAENDYDDLFVVTLTDKPKLIRLHYH